MTACSESFDVEDPQVGAFKAARTRSSVLKLAVLSIRSQLNDIPIFVFEGVDDKAVYSQWIRRIRPGINYEPLPANGKDQALLFWDSLLRDKNGLLENIFVFVDRDFDDLKGRDHHSNLFMTDFYAVENYVVCEEVLNDILKNELHCHGAPEVRAGILGQFREVYRSFLDVVVHVNFRVFCARKLNIEIENLPKKISKLAIVTLDQASQVEASAESLGELAREPTQQEIEKMRVLFAELDPPTRFRGKFLLMFFSKWLELLALERVRRSTTLMASLDAVTKVGANHSSIGYLASRSPIPAGLDVFLNQVAS